MIYPAGHKLDENQIFVFGSNLSGFHGAGAAKYALQHYGAVYGEGVGLFGQSYALPTKDELVDTMSLAEIEGFVDDFVTFAHHRPHLEFFVTDIGCGLAGHLAENIAPMFRDAPSNCVFSTNFNEILRLHGNNPYPYDTYEGEVS